METGSIGTRAAALPQVAALRENEAAERAPDNEAAEVAKAAAAGGESVAEAARRLGVLPDAELAEVLDLDRMAGAEW